MSDREADINGLDKMSDDNSLSKRRRAPRKPRLQFDSPVSKTKWVGESEGSSSYYPSIPTSALSSLVDSKLASDVDLEDVREEVEKFINSLTSEMLHPNTPIYDATESDRETHETLKSKIKDHYEGSIPWDYKNTKCNNCRRANFEICDFHYQADKVCWFCRRHGYECKINKKKSRKGPSVISFEDRRHYIPKMSIIEGVKLKRSRYVHHVAQLPDDLLLETTLLDELHRSISYHSKVYNTFYNENGFKSMESTSLLFFGTLAEEIIREQIQEHLKPFSTNPIFLENDPEIFRIRNDCPDDLKGRCQMWRYLSKWPPIPPYLQGQSKLDNTELEEEELNT